MQFAIFLGRTYVPGIIVLILILLPVSAVRTCTYANSNPRAHILLVHLGGSQCWFYRALRLQVAALQEYYNDVELQSYLLFARCDLCCVFSRRYIYSYTWYTYAHIYHDNHIRVPLL